MSLKGKKTLKFKLLSVPTNAASAKVEKEIAIADGSEQIRTLIYWVKDVCTVLAGLNLTTGPDQDNLVQQVLTGQVLTSYMGAMIGKSTAAHERARETAKKAFIAANPAVGIASLIADFVFKDPLAKIFSFQYQVSGPWAAPVIERTSSSAYFARFRSLDVMVPSQPNRNPSGIETIPGFASGK